MGRIMLIAGGTFQVPLARRIKEMGHHLIVVNPYCDSPAFKYADETILEDVLNKETILNRAEAMMIDAVLTDQTDVSVETVSYIASHLGLPGLPLDKVALFTNKYVMRKFSSQLGLPSPAYCRCYRLDEALDFLKGKTTPVIIKPCNAQSSRGVYIINGPKDMEAHFMESLSAAHGNSPHIVAEEFINGPEFTVDGIIVDGKHHTLAISKKKHFDHNVAIAKELFFSKDDPDSDYKKLIRQHDHLMNATHIPFALTHTEYRYKNGEYYLIEMAARGGGTLISSHIVKLMSGVDNYKLLIDQALGKPLDLTELTKGTPPNRVAVLKFFDIEQFGGVPGDLVQSICGEEYFNERNKVVAFDLEFKPFMRLEQAKDDRSRIGYYIAYDDSPRDLRERMINLEKHLNVEFIHQ